MSVESVPGCPGIHRVDAYMFDSPGFMSPYLALGDSVAVVDPGPATAADRVLDALDAVGVARSDVDAIVPTHVHLDHGGAAGALADACENATVYVHERGAPYLWDEDRLERLVRGARAAVGEELAAGYGDPTVVPADRVETVTDGDAVAIGDRELAVVAAPGHAPHQVALHDSATGALFVGDAAGMWFGDGVLPATPPPDFDLEASLDTLSHLRARAPTTLCYAHFGARQDADEALAVYESRLPEWVDAVDCAREAVGDDVAAVAAELGGEWSSPTLTADVAGILTFLRD